METQDESPVIRTLSFVSCGCCTTLQETMLLIFLTHAGGISPPCEKLERRTSHLHVKQNLWGSQGCEPRFRDHCPPAEQGTVDGDKVSISVQLARAGPEQSLTLNSHTQGN